MNEHGPQFSDEESPENPFENSYIDRRTFLSVAAATGASLSLPGAVAGQDSIESDLLTDLAAFAINHTSAAYETGLLVEFTDPDAAVTFDETFPDDAIDDRVRPEKTVIRSTPTPAGHGLLTGPEVETLLGLEGIERIEFSPGANPFWRLDDTPYQDGVFPSVENARDYLSFEETVAGLDHLESAHSDRLNVTTLSRESPGWNNLFLDERERYPVYVAELTNDIDDEAAFEEKEKVSYVLSIHGNEPQGREAGTRVIEDVLTGDAEPFAELLDDIVLVFAYVNPDGWMSREPFTELPYDAPFNDVNFVRGNGPSGRGQLDTNRQYPTIGWTNPDFYPAEPEDAPDFFEDLVPDSLAVVEHFREYENVEFLCDYHGMGISDQMVLNLETNASYGHSKTHDLDEVSIQTGEAMVDEWGDVDTISDDVATALEEHYPPIVDGDQYVPTGDSYNGLLDWGTIFDTIGYQVTGGLIGWAGAPESDGGLGAATVAPEMFHSNPFRNTYMNWKPYWARHQVTSYRISMLEYARLGAAETDATVVTQGIDTAYIESDELTRSSEDLPHTGDATAQQAGSTQRRAESRTLQAGGGTNRSQVQSNPETHSLSVQFHGQDVTGELRLHDPEGTVVRRVGFDDTPGPEHSPSTLFVSDPAAGSWTLELDGEGRLEADLTMLDVTAASPDPRQAWDGDGFEQREYEVNPMQFFADLAEFADDGTLEGITADDAVTGLGEYDQLVLSHDGPLDDDEFLAAIETFLEDGGDLVLTDTGVHLLGAIDVGALSAIDPGDIEDILVTFAVLSDRDTDHPLLRDIRGRQQEIWKGPQVGYTAATDQPATVVDPDAFRLGGGDAAGILGAEGGRFGADAGGAAIGQPGVGAGSVSLDDADINIIGSVLPPANQSQLHPFGMADYSLSFMGHTMLCNALGYAQQRFRDGELVRTYGPTSPVVVGSDPVGDLDGDGHYEDIDGDGELTLTDVQLLFSRRDDPVVQENASLFNFSGGDADRVTTDDVQALFREYVSE